MISSTLSVDALTPVTPADLLASSAFTHSFPSTELVDAAAAMFHGHRVSDRTLGVTLLGHDVSTPSGRKARELGFVRGDLDHVMVEGPRWRVMVSPGTVSVRYQDPARRDRTHERQVRAEQGHDGLAVMPVADRGTACVTAWSGRSRARMAETFAMLDWSPMFDGGGIPAMVTLTYPGDWLAVAPHAGAATRHVNMLRKRFLRAWGVKMVGVWKREFQRRGAPHYHVLMIPPHGYAEGSYSDVGTRQIKGGGAFRQWLSQTWAEVVGSRKCGRCHCTTHRQLTKGVTGPERPGNFCCERAAHIAAGTGIDFAEGVKARDPRSIGVYFAKHGSFAEKEYQNHAPAEWVETGSVGRFWGVWGLDKALAGTLVAPVEARAAVRTLRRHSRANSYVTRVPVWRYRTVVDPDTGQVTAKWRKASKKKRVWRMKGDAGFVVTKNGPALASAVARHLDQLRGRGTQAIGPAGGSPVGFLP